jgi:hypothetical protein
MKANFASMARVQDIWRESGNRVGDLPCNMAIGPSRRKPKASFSRGKPHREKRDYFCLTGRFTTQICCQGNQKFNQTDFTNDQLFSSSLVLIDRSMAAVFTNCCCNYNKQQPLKNSFFGS